MRKRFLILSTVLIFLIVIGTASAIVIIPARTTLNYEPGKTVQITVRVAQLGEGMSYTTKFAGDDIEYAKIMKKEENHVVVEFTMPENTRPGQHQLKIGLVETLSDDASSGALGARAGVYSQVRFFVPYPAKYAEISLDNVDAAAGKMAYFTVSLQNYGKEIINSMRGNITVLDPYNKTVAVLPLSERNELHSMQNTEMFALWDTENESAGIYTVLARVDYDDIETTAAARLRLGTVAVSIDSIRAIGTVDTGFVKINIDASSVWNEMMTNVYAKGWVSKNGTHLAELKSASFDVPPWGKNTLVLYWDVLGLNVGVYDINVAVYYEDKVTETTTQIYLMEEEEPEEEAVEISTLLYGAVFLLLLAVIFLAVVVLNIRKRKTNETEKFEKYH